jgi:hypothetical protein
MTDGSDRSATLLSKFLDVLKESKKGMMEEM